MTYYMLEHNDAGPVIATSLEVAQRHLMTLGFVQQQPDPDLDPQVECWRRNTELVRIIPAILIEDAQ